MTPSRSLHCAALAAAVVLAGTACTSSSKAPNSSVNAGGTKSSSNVVPSTPGRPSTPAPTSTTTLGGTCDTVLPITAVDQAVGVPIVGKASFIVNQPDTKVGQVERLNCRYGIAPVKAGSAVTDTKVEVSVSLYATDALAAARVMATEDQWRGQGAVPHAVSVGAHPATVLTGYGKPLLVLNAGPRTVAVTLTASVVAAAKLDTALIAVATRALRGAGG